MNHFERASATISMSVGIGDVYRIFHGPNKVPVLVELTGADYRGYFQFKMLRPADRRSEAMELYSQIEGLVLLEPRLFERMRGDGRAVMPYSRARSRKELLDVGDVTPLNLLEPGEPGISRREKKHREAKIKEYEQKRCTRFYVVKADEEGYLGRSGVNTRRFIRNHSSEAADKGLHYVPSYGTLLRAIENCGEPGSRPLSAFFYDYSEYERYAAWHPDVRESFEDAVDAFYHKDAPRISKVRYDFYEAINKRRRELEEAGREVPANLEKPSETTFRDWLYAREDWWRCKARHGELVANVRFRGQGRHIQATRPLEYVIFDHTVADCWAIIEDDDGYILVVERPTLTVAIDVFSRMILAAVISYEQPGLYQVMAALKQVIAWKEFLVDEFGASPATDGWGKPLCIIVDNGWEWCGMSFQMTCEAAGIDVIWAPVRTPQFKSIGESIFRTVNVNFWHELKGGIRFTPQVRSKLGIDARVTAAHTMEQLKQLLWARIILYHNTTHSQTRHKPALLWKKGLETHDRPVIDDITTFGGFLGKGERVKLTNQGIHLGGEHYHDQRITSELLERLLPRAKRNSKKGNPLRRGVVELYASRDPVDASYIDVWDHVSKIPVRLPHATLTKRVSWKALKALRAFVKKENEEFFSDDDLIRAHAEFNRLVKAHADDLPFGKRRRLAPEVEPAPELKPGNRVQTVVTSASPTGMNDVPHKTAAKGRDDNMVPAYGPHRGKPKKKSKKNQAVETPRKSKAYKNIEAEHAVRPISFANTGKLPDPDAFMANL